MGYPINMKTTNNSKALTVGTDYRETVGLPSSCKMIYLGGISWECHTPDGRVVVLDNAQQTANVLAYVSTPNVKIG